MKSLKYIAIITLLVSAFPFVSKANIGVESESKVQVNAPFENGIHLRKLDLQNKLWKEEIEEHKDRYQKAREAFKNSTSDTRNMMRAEFRMTFVERFTFAYTKLSEFQTRMDAKIEVEENAGVETEKSETKLEESKSFMVTIQADLQALKALLNERYAEDEKEAKKEEAKALVEKLKTNTKASHEALRESLKELRLAKLEVETSAQVELDNN